MERKSKPRQLTDGTSGKLKSENQSFEYNFCNDVIHFRFVKTLLLYN